MFNHVYPAWHKPVQRVLFIIGALLCITLPVAYGKRRRISSKTLGIVLGLYFGLWLLFSVRKQKKNHVCIVYILPASWIICPYHITTWSFCTTERGATTILKQRRRIMKTKTHSIKLSFGRIFSSFAWHCICCLAHCPLLSPLTKSRVHTTDLHALADSSPRGAALALSIGCHAHLACNSPALFVGPWRNTFLWHGKIRPWGKVCSGRR